MRRWIAALFLVLTAFYLGAADREPCEQGSNDCTQVCHILCDDGCAVAPIPKSPIPPPPGPLPRTRYEQERALDIASLHIEPEKQPPRA